MSVARDIGPLSVKLMDYESGAELRLEPCSLRRHNVAGVGYVHELLH